MTYIKKALAVSVLIAVVPYKAYANIDSYDPCNALTYKGKWYGTVVYDGHTTSTKTITATTEKYKDLIRIIIDNTLVYEGSCSDGRIVADEGRLQTRGTILGDTIHFKTYTYNNDENYWEYILRR